MKSLIKKTKTKAKLQAPPDKKVVAQCCAKVSKVVAGCHD